MLVVKIGGSLLTALSREDVVDPLFCSLLHGSALEAWICGPARHAMLRAALDAGTGLGKRLVHASEPAADAAPRTVH